MYPPSGGKWPPEPSAPPNAYPPPARGIPTAIPPQQCNNYHYPFPVPAPPGAHIRSGWMSGVCHCFDDPSNCEITCFCPCITFGQIAEIVDRGATSCGTAGALYGLIMYVTGLACLYSCFYRSKLRAQCDLVESPAADFLVHLFCEPCSLCQEYNRELKARGFDLAIGWQANVDRQNRASVTIPPVVAQE